MIQKIDSLWQEFISQLKITEPVTAGDFGGWLISILIAILSAIIVWKVVNKIQLNISRSELVYNMDNNINELYADNAGMTSKKEPLTVRFLLHSTTPWLPYEKKTKIRTINGQRYVKIRNKYKNEDKKYSAEYISTKAIHEMMITFREIDKLRRCRIMKQIDLADLHHEIVPWFIAGRMEFVASYLGESDAQVLGIVLIYMTISCYKNFNMSEVQTIREYYNNHIEIHKYAEKNNRFRLWEKISLWKFKRIMRYGYIFIP